MATNLRFDLSKILDELEMPTSSVEDGIAAVRVKNITLMDKAGSGIRLTVSAREASSDSSASTFIQKSFFYLKALKSFDVIAAVIAIHYDPEEDNRSGAIKTISLYSGGASNLKSYSPNEQDLFERYLKNWGISSSATHHCDESPLYFLSKKIEAASGYVIPYLVDESEQGVVNTLRELNFLSDAKHAPSFAHICPICHDETFTPKTSTCKACGKIDIDKSDIRILEPNLFNIFRKIQQALRIEESTVTPIDADKKIWLLGQIGGKGQNKKIIFARNLGQTQVMNSLLSGLPNHVGSLEAIIITTANTNSLAESIPGLTRSLRYFSFRTQFHLDGENLIASSPLLEATKPPVSGGVIAVHGRFSSDFRHVYLKDREFAVPLSRNRAKVFQILWEANGQMVSTQSIVDQIYNNNKIGKNLDDIFQRVGKPGKDANDAFKALVGRKPGFYWLKEEAFEKPLHTNSLPSL